MSSNKSSHRPEAESSKTAIWIPAWHELDQSLMVGLRQKYYFFDQLPAEFATGDCDLMFFNGLAPGSNCDIRFAKVTSIVHPTLGEILRVDTMGLDYILYPADGEEVVLDAEENPGSVLSGLDDPIAAWTLQVLLEEVSQPIADLA